MPRYNRIDVIASLPQHLLILSSFRHLCLLKQTFGMLYGYIRLIFSCIWQNTILQLSSNGNKKLTNVSQLFLNLSPHSLIYSSANMRQLLPTAVASLGNRIIELITCARWINGSVHGTSSARQRSRISFERFITSTPLVIEREKSSVKLVPTFILRQNLHIIDIAVSFHRIKLTNVESCEASNVFKHVQTSVQASTFFVKILISAITLLLPSSNETHTWMIENRRGIDEQTQSNSYYSLTFFDKFAAPSILSTSIVFIVIERNSWKPKKEGSVETTEGNVVAS